MLYFTTSCLPVLTHVAVVLSYFKLWMIVCVLDGIIMYICLLLS